MCKISIITVTYNASCSLPKTLNSVRTQNSKDYELIVIDGGSSDGTTKIIQDNKDIISFSISEKDRGIYDGMNKGIDKAKGEYCMFLNAGDALYDANSLDVVIETLNSMPIYDIYFFDAYYEKAKGKKYFKPRLEKLPWRFCHQSMLFKTSMIKQHKYDIKYRLSGDSELIYRLISLGYTKVLIEKPVVLEEAGAGATYNNLVASCKELYSILYLKDHMSIVKINYNMLKVRIYTFLNKIRNND